MKTVIKYRAYNKNERVFFFWDLTFAFGGTGKVWGPVERFTEMTDKNKKDIYEGDKVKIKYALNHTEAIGVVEMIDGAWSVSFKKFEKKPLCPTHEIYRDMDYLKMFTTNALPNNIEVVGNVHEN